MKLLMLGSSGIHIERWAKFFLRRGDEVHIATKLDYKINGVKIHKLNPDSGLYSFINNAFRLKKIIKEVNPDILYAQYLTTYGLLAAYFGFKNILVSVIGSDIFIFAKKFPFNILVRHYLKKFKMINVESEAAKKEVLKYFDDESKIVTKNWGVNFKYFNPKINGSDIRKKFGFKKDNFVICSMRRLEKILNIETIIQTFKLVSDQRSDARLMICSDGPLRKSLENLVSKLNLENKIFFTGDIPHKDVGKYLCASDLYVQTPLSDSLSISMLEAMACKVPCVSSDVGGNGEYLRHNYNGFLVDEPTDYNQLAKSILELMSNLQERKLFAERAFKLVIRKCDEKKNMGYIASQFKKIIKSSEDR